MKRTIYHGSGHIIQTPLFGGGNRYNDFGPGFYCTDSPEMAKEWAVGRDASGFANRYSIECDGLTILDLNDSQYGTLRWLAVLLENRELDASSAQAQQAKEYLREAFRVDCGDCDCVIGTRADDSNFSFAQDFINGAISYRQLKRALRPIPQFVVKSERAFERIAFEGYETARCAEWYIRRMSRDRAARREFATAERSRLAPGDLFVNQIIGEEMKANDPRLR